jgi:hypothetical protein
MTYRVFYSALSEVQIQQGLQVAQQALLARRTFELSRFTYYLRVCCFVMQKIEWLSPDMDNAIYHSMSYPDLMKALTTQDRVWWQKCYVNKAGFLQSDDPSIHALLNPIEEFYAAVTAAIATSTALSNITPRESSIELSA